jgi:hypothetical protein
MSRVSVLMTVGRVAALVLLLVAMVGPWTFDSHPDAEESCSAPLVWLGGGRCACLVSFMKAFEVTVNWGNHGLLWLLFLPLLPFLSTPLLLLGRGLPWLRVFHVTAWGLAAAFLIVFLVLFWYQYEAVSLRLWGIWLSAAVAVASLAGEILAAKQRPDQELRPTASGAN